MGFKKLRGVALPEEKQGLIRYSCLTYKEQPRHIQNKIQRLCREVGGAYQAALWDVMCSKSSITSIAERARLAEQMKYGIIIVACIPMMLMFPFVVKHFKKGVMVGSIKS